jgi:hypothetical protein
VKVVVLLGLVVDATIQEDCILINRAERGLEVSVGCCWNDQASQACRLKWIVTSIARFGYCRTSSLGATPECLSPLVDTV